MPTINPIVCLLTAVFLCGISVSHSTAMDTNWEGPFFFIQMADPQLGMISGNASVEEEVALFEQAIAIANRLNPAFVVVCGDLVNTPGDDEQAQALHQVANKLEPEIPLYWVPGNHDVGGEPTYESQTWYMRNFGEPRYTFESGGCQFVVLDTTIIKHFYNVREMAREQWLWLKEQLRQSDAFRHTILFQHHPWFLAEADEPDGYFSIPKQRRAKYLDILKGRVSAVFAGHYHRNSLAALGEMEMVTTGPVGKPLGEDPSGLRIVKVFEDHIEHTYYPLDAVPDVIALRLGDAEVMK